MAELFTIFKRNFVYFDYMPLQLVLHGPIDNKLALVQDKLSAYSV